MRNHDMRLIGDQYVCSHCRTGTRSLELTIGMQITPCGHREPRWRPSWALGAVVVLAALLPATQARAASCDELSYGRNRIYANMGYCFKTARQIAIFGNSGCQYDNQNEVPLSAIQRDDIAYMLMQERMLGCR